MKYKLIITKIGGKIFEKDKNLQNTLNQFKDLLGRNIIEKLIIIPGGGSYANFVRNLDRKLNIGDDLSHWMAIFAMNCNGEAISREYKDIKCIKEIKELKESEDSISIFLPFDFLFETDELPHSWDVTSDSITLYMANKLGLSECFLIKDVDGILLDNNEVLRDISIHEHKILKNSISTGIIKSDNEGLKQQTTPIDSYLLQLISNYGISCTLLNGRSDTNRIVSYFDDKISKRDKIYTKIRNIH